MITSYEDIHGWFDYKDLYSEFSSLLTDSKTFVEVGVWKGKSISFLATDLKQSNKKPTLFAIDTFKGTAGDPGHRGMIDSLQVSLLDHFKENLKHLEIDDYVNIIKKDSVEASEMFQNETIDIIFIDADHSYEAVKKDLEAWYPKVKRNGIIAGHDYLGDHWPGVKKAVDEFFVDKNTTVTECPPSSWKAIKK